MRRLVGLTIVGVLLVSAALLGNYALNHVSPISHSDASIIRLHDPEGNFFCSGVVISPHLIATAAHCVSMETPFGLFVNLGMQIEVRGHDMKRTGIIAHIKNLNARLDTALLEGNFGSFAERSIEENPAIIDQIMMDPESQLVTCGYPMGGPLACSKITKVRHGFYSMYYADGWMYPGMSGGPVIDLRTGKVLAVNRGIVESGELIFNPLSDLLSYLLPPRG